MISDFIIRDSLYFVWSGETLDIAELISVGFQPGEFSTVEMRWRIPSSNQQIAIVFSEVQDFIVTGRDLDYPTRLGSMLKLAGFTNGSLGGGDPELYVEAEADRNYMTFVMADTSAIMVKAETASMRLT